ncbi:septum formation initiator family protein [Corynebacterium sp. p3-SID1145]|uniref:septum formation initiator family protein n=1 Tax=unclassified Corynebacterium TaxID=2624378 RepID=UPI0021AA6674|nr:MULTISPECIES: septum formation initiator family protein [unclassified Corynebacterium]MCT1452600.1 septum formation initiator family protein [Corynebacterium sp. p3-SID1145]MCT1461502.1 septum formation initiator family protein [Corynebacterium sp. p3-SID1140]
MATSSARGARRSDTSPQRTGMPGRAGGSRRRPTTVPVASRDAERAARKQKRPRTDMLKGDIVGVAVLITVVLVVLVAIAVPLRNYYTGKAEIARLNESIAAKQEEKAQLQEDLERYSDPEYAKQEARRRLSMVEPGETAWRIIDPRMEGSTITSEHAEDPNAGASWNEILWNSLREVPKEEEAAPPEEIPEQQ